MINQILYALFDKFKSKNLKQFGALVIALTALNLLLSNQELMDSIGAPQWAVTAAQVVSLLYTAIKGVDTKSQKHSIK